MTEEELKEIEARAEKTKWIRCRFHANLDDYRPIKWPPAGPYWCSGISSDCSIVIAYVKQASQIKEFWPEAHDEDCESRDEITYTNRFPKPDWWEGE